MDCVYFAYVSHLEDMGEKARLGELAYFKAMRRLLNNNQDGMTPISIAPYIVGRLARRHGMVAVVQTSHYMTGEHWVNAAPSDYAQLAAAATDWQYIDRVTLEPAIYGLWSENHALYSKAVPPNRVSVVAIQLRRK